MAGVKREVSALEYEALLNLDKVLRIAMIRPKTGEFIAVAIQALDKVREDEGIEGPNLVVPADPNEGGDVRQVSGLAQALIKRAMDKKP